MREGSARSSSNEAKPSNVRIFELDILTYHGFFDPESDILKPRWLPTVIGHLRDLRRRAMAGDDIAGEFVIISTSIPDKASDPSERQPTDEELSALARFRFALRRFLAFSEQAAADLGLTMQWYQALLVIKTFRADDHISVGELAEQLMIRDHSAAELVSRLVQAKLVRRKTDPSDRRRSLVIMTPAGDRRLAQLAAVHLERLRENKDAFLNLFSFDQE